MITSVDDIDIICSEYVRIEKLTSLEKRVMAEAFQRAKDTGNTSVVLFPLSCKAEIVLTTSELVIRANDNEVRHEVSEPSIFYGYGYRVGLAKEKL